MGKSFKTGEMERGDCCVSDEDEVIEVSEGEKMNGLHGVS